MGRVDSSHRETAIAEACGEKYLNKKVLKKRRIDQ
jgi:hypothetical protein